MIDKNPLVSVLMTAYNREIFISEAIESVLASTFKDFELIIVDDCSKDNTVEIARKYEELDSRVKVYVNEVNLGDYPNRNKAASYARGKYLKYLDSDDVMTDNCLSIMVEGMENNPDVGFGICSSQNVGIQKHTPHSSYNIHFFQRNILNTGPSGSMIKNEVFKKEGGFNENRCTSDIEFWMRIGQKYNLLEFNENLIFWREHPDQEKNLGKDEYLMNRLNIITKLLMQDTCPLERQQIETIIASEKFHLSRFLVKSFFKRSLLKSIIFWRSNKLSFYNIIR